jgi:hypothetical protein
MNKGLFLILTLLICSIYTLKHKKPRNLQKILKGLDNKTRFAEISEKSALKA